MYASLHTSCNTRCLKKLGLCIKQRRMDFPKFLIQNVTHRSHVSRLERARACTGTSESLPTLVLTGAHALVSHPVQTAVQVTESVKGRHDTHILQNKTTIRNNVIKLG